MSQNNNNLTAEQQEALNNAINMYVLKQMKHYGGIKANPVILIPRFEEDTDGQWVPIEDTGIRPTKKDGLTYVRFGMAYAAINDAGKSKIKVMKTNMFDDEAEIEMLLEAYDMRIGSALPDHVLVIEETIDHPGTTLGGNLKGGYQIKYAGESNIPCTFTGIRQKVDMETGEIVQVPYVNAPIYRRIKLAVPGTTNTLIQHTNGAELSKFASAAWIELNKPKPQSPGIHQAAENAAKVTELKDRLKALKKIKAAQRDRKSVV